MTCRAVTPSRTMLQPTHWLYYEYYYNFKFKLLTTEVSTSSEDISINLNRHGGDSESDWKSVRAETTQA